MMSSFFMCISITLLERLFMIQGYTDFYYNVTDMNRAVQFYSESLGMTKVFGHEY